MSNLKLTQRPETTTLADSDILHVVTDVGGTPTTKYIQAVNARRELAGTIPQNSQSADYTAVLSDKGGHLLHPSSDNNPRTFTIPANASVAFPIGTAITFVNKINTVTIAITSDTLTWSKTGGTGSRTLAANGMCTALKISSTEWMISGEGLS